MVGRAGRRRGRRSHIVVMDTVMSQPLPYGIAPSSFRLPAATHVGGVHLQVGDLDRSLAYYTGVLGLRVVRQTTTTAALAPHGDDHVLIDLHARAGATPVPRGGRLGLFHFAILVPDRATLGRFLRHIADRGVYAGSADHAVSEALYLTDPDGLGIEVYADRPRPSWRVTGQELFMTTEPLDVRDLMRAAADQPWTGMPADTVMGHVHLHGGDLDAAAAFYHAGLGLDKVVWSYPGALFLSAGGYHHHLGTNTWAAGAAPAGDGEARLLAWDLVLPDATSVAEAVESLETAGHPATTDDGAMRVRDPWGTAVRLLAR
jgi:catechol 2,3-dioxygenase